MHSSNYMFRFVMKTNIKALINILSGLGYVCGMILIYWLHSGKPLSFFYFILFAAQEQKTPHMCLPGTFEPPSTYHC